MHFGAAHDQTSTSSQNDGLEIFVPTRDLFTHLHCNRDHETFANRRVMVVGMGNTGGDVAAELSRHAAKVLLSTRRGAWVINRIGRSNLTCILYSTVYYIYQI